MTVVCVTCWKRDPPVMEKCWRSAATFNPATYHRTHSIVCGLCRCHACGWSDGGELRVVDVTAEQAPPIPYGSYPAYAVIGDPEHGWRSFCPDCNEPLEPWTVAFGKAAA